MGGYSKRVIRIDFPDLTDDPAKDEIWVALRNPRLVPPHELVPDSDTAIVDGQPVDAKAATNSMHQVFAKILVGWRAYDASTPIELDATGNDVTQQVLLPHGPGSFTAENVAKLPLEIINAIGNEVKEASTPR